MSQGAAEIHQAAPYRVRNHAGQDSEQSQRAPPSVDRELKRAAAAAKGKSKERAPTPTPSPATATASDQPSPIEVRDRTPDEQVEVVEISEDQGLKKEDGQG